MASNASDVKKAEGPASQPDTTIDAKEPKRAEFTAPDAPDLDPDIRVVLALVLGMFTLFGIYFYYRIDLRNNGPFAAFVNDVILGGDPHKQVWLGVVQPEVRASMEAAKKALKATRSAVSAATSSALSSARDEL